MKKVTTQGFTLLETLASIAMLSLIIVGPLSITISSSGFARLTKDTIIATYLAEEAVELLQNQYDSLYVYCQKNENATLSGGYCDPAGTLETTTGETAWRLFKNKLSSAGGGSTCYLPKDGEEPGYPTDLALNPNGCSFDSINMQASSTQELVKYDASTENCKYLVPLATSTTIIVASTTGGGVYKDGRNLTSQGGELAGDSGYVLYKSLTATSTSYVCAGEPSHVANGEKVQAKEYIRSVTVEQLPTFETGFADQQYSDDLRITSNVQFKALNGTSHSVKITRFMHARP